MASTTSSGNLWQRLGCRLLIGCLVAGALAAPGGSAIASVAVAKPPVRVSGPDPLDPVLFTCNSDQAQRGYAHESSLAINPVNRDNLAAVWIQDAADGIVSASSLDGGRTWIDVPVPNKACIPPAKTGDDAALYDSTLDPWLAFTSSGTLVVAAQVVDHLNPSRIHAIAVNRSTDGGRSWKAPVFLARDQVAVELTHPTLVAGPGVVYLAWGGSGQNGYVSVSTDDGISWSTPTVIYSAAGGVVEPMQLLVLPDGTLAATVARLDPALAPGGGPFSTTLLMTRSSDRGLTWSLPAVIALPADPNHNMATSSALAPDGTIYVAWQTTSPRPAYLFSRSIDGGRTWSRPTAVDGDIGSPVLGNAGDIPVLAAPALAVNESGTIGVAFYRHSSAPCNTTTTTPPIPTDMWLRHSHDKGLTWDETHLAGPFDYSALMVANDYQGITSIGGAFGTTYSLGAPCQGREDFTLTNAHSDIFFSKTTR